MLTTRRFVFFDVNLKAKAVQFVIFFASCFASPTSVVDPVTVDHACLNVHKIRVDSDNKR